MEKIQFKDHIWLASLLHYLYPLFVEYDLLIETNTPYTQTIDFLRQKSNFFNKYSSSIQSNSEDETLISKLVLQSSVLSSMEKSTLQKGYGQIRPLQAVFSNLFEQQSDKIFTYPMKPLDLQTILPASNEKEDSSKQLFTSFLNELEKVKQKEQFLFLLEKYFWGVSSSTSEDISLFDEMKTTAAIAVSLYKQYEKGFLHSYDIDQLSNSKTCHFLLLHGDLSGIQNFIFNIPSKGAAKSLKGRSVYISLLSDVIVRYLIENLELEPTNLLYNGGGNFFILLPFYQQDKVTQLRKEIVSRLLHAHDGDIYFAIDFVPVTPNDFQDFTVVWDQAKTLINTMKKKKWSELGLESQYCQIFGPLDNGAEEQHVCEVCGSFGSNRSISKEMLDDKSVSICTLCKSFINLTNQLRDAKYIVFQKRAIQSLKYDTYQDIFQHFGYQILFSTKKTNLGLKEQESWYTINETNFLERNCSGFQFGAYHLPHGKEGQITFEELSKLSITDGRGDTKLAHLKLDVDNLGSLFSLGLGERRSIARVSVLSRMLNLYFSGYINFLIREKGWADKLYVVFSGGDDTYIVGAWNTVFEFVEEFYQKFRTFTCENRYVTFSAGINVFPYQYPIIRAADITESSLDTAKKPNTISQHGLPPIKNKVSLLGEVFNWVEFNQIREIKTILEEMVKYYNRSILYKVHKSTLGFKQILKDSTNGKFHHVKFWRLAYYLREVKRDYENSKKKNKPIFKEDYVQKLLDQYRSIVIHNIFQTNDTEQIRKIMIIPAAVKWTELATRKMEEEEK